MGFKKSKPSKRAWGKQSRSTASSRQPDSVHSKGWHQTGGLKHNKEVVEEEE